MNCFYCYCCIHVSGETYIVWSIYIAIPSLIICKFFYIEVPWKYIVIIRLRYINQCIKQCQTISLEFKYHWVRFSPRCYNIIIFSCTCTIDPSNVLFICTLLPQWQPDYHPVQQLIDCFIRINGTVSITVVCSYLNFWYFPQGAFECIFSMVI